MVSPLQGDRVVLVSCPKPPGRMLLSCELTLGCSVDYFTRSSMLVTTSQHGYQVWVKLGTNKHIANMYGKHIQQTRITCVTTNSWVIGSALNIQSAATTRSPVNRKPNSQSPITPKQPSRDKGGCDSQPRLRLATEVSVYHVLVTSRNQRLRLATSGSDLAAVVTTRNRIRYALIATRNREISTRLDVVSSRNRGFRLATAVACT